MCEEMNGRNVSHRSLTIVAVILIAGLLAGLGSVITYYENAHPNGSVTVGKPTLEWIVYPETERNASAILPSMTSESQHLRSQADRYLQLARTVTDKAMADGLIRLAAKSIAEAENLEQQPRDENT
jgi:hypothetical protein